MSNTPPRGLALLTLLAALVCASSVPAPARAQSSAGIIRVATSGTDAPGCGTAALPCATLGYAIDTTRDVPQRLFRTAELRVAAGTYRHSGDPRKSVVMLDYNGKLTLRGGYSTADWNVSDPATNETIIDGEQTYRGVAIVPFNTNSTACDFDVSGFTISNGLASAAMYEGPTGGGVLVSNACASARLSNLVVRNNQAQGTFAVGGGIAIQGGASGDKKQCLSPTTVMLTTITLASNQATATSGDGNGGGLFVFCGSVQASGLTASENTAHSNDGNGVGGGLSLILAPSFSLSGVQVLRNSATSGSGVGEGGGVFVERSNGSMDAVAVRGNEAVGLSGIGGGVFATDNTGFTLSSADIADNSATGQGSGARDEAVGGGMILNLNTNGTANTFSGRNLIISGNRATSPTVAAGGGLSCYKTTMTLNNTTVVSNTTSGGADAYGAALSLIDGCAGTVSNSIVVQNGSSAPIFANSLTAGVTFNTNMFKTESSSAFEDPAGRLPSSNELLADPIFDTPLDYHLAAGSPAIDAATGSVFAAASDIDGQPRPLDAAPDLGADEFSAVDARASAPIPYTVQQEAGVVMLNWSAPSPFVDRYLLTFDPPTVAPLALPAAESGATIAGLTGNTPYTVTLIALNGDGAQIGQSSFALTVTPQPWLVLLYLAGDDRLPGSDRPSLTEPLSALRQRLSLMPYNPAARIVALYDGNQPGDSAVYVREAEGLRAVPRTQLWAAFPATGELDTGSAATLQDFIGWARATYPAQHTMLSIVDHGGGWAPDFGKAPLLQRTGTASTLGRSARPTRREGVVQAGGWRGMSMDTSSDTSLATLSTGQALGGSGGPLDVLFFDACLMGMVESAYEVRDDADYMVAGENLLFSDLPYTDYLAPANLSAATTPRDLARTIVQRYNSNPDAALNPFTMAALDLRQLRADVPNNLAARVNTLAGRLLAELPDPVPTDDPLQASLRAVYTQAQKFDYDSSATIDPTDGYVDLGDFSRRLSASSDPAVSAATRLAAAAVLNALVPQGPGTFSGPLPLFIAQRAVSGAYNGVPWDFGGASGVAIYLPIGERDNRPTLENPGGATLPALPERQLGYYTDPAQLTWTRDAPQWGALLVRLEPNTPERDLTLRPFRSPNQIPGAQLVYLPLTVRNPT